MLSRTVRHGISAASWNTNPSRFGTPRTTVPSTVMEPELYGASPAIILISVVLPPPDAPTRLTNSPAAMSRFTLRKVTFAEPRRRE